MSTRHVIIGTAGHVDHGKTALIRSLTGVNTDRLREEQERGMTIDLGFAPLSLPDGTQAGIVDVPGHERFLKNMLAGAGGVNLVLLVIAADEGVMPQTLEHLDILRLLRIPSGMVVFTKADLVDQEWLDLIREDVGRQLRGSFLEGSPMLAVSSITGQGIEELRAEIARQIAREELRQDSGPFRLPVDRAFTMPGFGTVVTGTLHGGSLRVGESVVLQPSGIPSRVRGLQSHGQKQEVVHPGMRVAANLAGLEIGDIRRGETLAPPELLTPSHLVDVQLELLDRLEEPLKNRTRIRLHVGTDEVIGRCLLLDREELAAGETGMAQLQLESPVAVLRGDRFVIRLYSPMMTLGGGAILDPRAKRHRRFDPATLDRLAVLGEGDLDSQVEHALREGVYAARTAREVAATLDADVASVAEALSALVDRGAAMALGDRFLHVSDLDSISNSVERTLADYHRRFPLRQGMSREEARTRVGSRVDARLWNALVERWQAEGRVGHDRGTVYLAGHRVVFNNEQERQAATIRQAFVQHPFDPPSIEESIAAAGGSGGAEVFEALVEGGDLVKLATGLYIASDALELATATVRELAAQVGAFSVSQVRDKLGSSRKVVVPLLEHLDSIHVTQRQGDQRICLSR